MGQTKGAKWIFVLSTTNTLYVGIKKKVWPHSGHYRPSEENFQDFISFLHENDVDTSNNVKAEDQTTETMLDCYSDEEHEPEIENEASTNLSFKELIQVTKEIHPNW
ncbi:hypothetical protein R6Q57_020126 [Mikania cordata]